MWCVHRFFFFFFSINTDMIWIELSDLYRNGHIFLFSPIGDAQDTHVYLFSRP